MILSSALHKHHGVKQDSSIEKKLKDLCPEVADKWYFYLYSKSKMCNMLTAFKLHRDESANGISVYSVHPGVVRTELHRDAGFAATLFKFFSTPFTKNISQGAATSVYCAAHPEVEKVSGKYWDSCWDDECELDKRVARDEELQEALWKHTEELIDKWLKTKKTTDKDSALRLWTYNFDDNQSDNEGFVDKILLGGMRLLPTHTLSFLLPPGSSDMHSTLLFY